MIVKQNDFQKQWLDIRDQAFAAIDRVGMSGWLILGNEVKSFELQLANYCKAQYSVGCANGLDAIEIALRCLDLPLGAKVLTTPLSAFATTLAIVRAGGIPVFVDVDASGLINLDLCTEILSSNPDIKYFVPVHLFGHSLSLEKLRSLKNKFNLYVIEDCAQAIGATSKGETVGSVGDMAAISFYPTKNLGCLGDGGAIITNHQEYWNRAKNLRDYGQSKKYEHTSLGMNSRLDELQAAIMNDALLPKLNDFVKRRCQIANYYRSKIRNPKIVMPPIPEDSASVWHLYPVLIRENRQQFQEYAAKNGINLSIHYPILISQQHALTHSTIPYIIMSKLENAECFAAQEISLPIHPYMTDNEVDYVIKICNSWGKH